MEKTNCNIGDIRNCCSFPVLKAGISVVAFAITLLFLSSCSNTKYLEKDETLYTRTWFNVKGFEKIKNKPLKAYELYLVGDVKTNRPIFLLPRTNLYIYNHWKPSGNWGLRHYIHRVFGKPPVLLKNVNPDFRLKVMKQRIAEMGHFDSEINLKLKHFGKNDKKVRAKFYVLFKPAYTYRNFDFIKKETKVDSIISASMAKNKIISGNDYWLKELKDERQRLNTIIKNQGYYFFNPSFLLFNADTAVGQKQVDLTMVVKDEIPENAYKKYFIRNIDILVKSNKESLKHAIPKDSVFLNNCNYKSIENPYRPKIITKAVSLKPGEQYSLTDHENTLRFLQGMGAFRVANVSFNSPDSSNQLDAHINIVPLKPIQTSLEMNFATKSNDFLGPSAIASIGHMNIFRGAERLILSVDGGFEWQKRSKRKEYELGLNSYEIGTQLKLIVPRFLLPFEVKNQSRRYVPKTLASIGFRTLKRVKYYTMNLSQAKFGYAWKSCPTREYQIEAVSIDYLRLTETSTEFEKFLVQYPQVATSFEEQFIIGSSFSYIYHSNPFNKKRSQFYNNPILDLSGNLINSIYTLAGIKDPNSDEPSKLLGSPYAQYFKITNDFRYYYIFNEKRQIASRFLAGIGVPYNNSTVLPYVKQYFAGGSQDIRAFYARSIGPGSYQPADSIPSGVFLDQSGEIKLEANFEYRFPITYKTYGALFMDAGNVWLLNEDPSRPGGKFEFDTFLKQIAVGAGFGLRIDIEFFVIRLDVGVPIRKPYLVNNSNWIFDNPGFWSDYVISFAIGYPF